MAVALDNNTWYSIPAVNTSHFVCANAPSINGGNISIGTFGASALWQVFQISDQTPAVILRPQSYGASYCMVNSGTNFAPTLQQCSNGSYSSYWYPEFVNGADHAQGWLISATWEIHTTEPLGLDPKSSSLLVLDSINSASTRGVEYSWAFSSVWPINDARYSQIPTVIYSSTSSPHSTASSSSLTFDLSTTPSSYARSQPTSSSIANTTSTTDRPPTSATSPSTTVSSITIASTSSSLASAPPLTSTDYVTVTPTSSNPPTSTVIVTVDPSSSSTGSGAISSIAQTKPSSSGAAGRANAARINRDLSMLNVILLMIAGSWLTTVLSQP